MLDNQLIEIMKIKNLHLIYCYVIDSKDYDNLDKSLAIEIVYGDKTKLCLDYKNKYFSYYLNTIKEVYCREKEKNNITFLSDFSRNVIENYNLDNYEEENYTDKNIYPINTSKFQIELMKPYLKQAIKSVLRTIHDIKEINNINIIGYRNKYVATYTVDEKQHIVSLYFNNKNNDEVDFKIGALDDVGIAINGSINFKNDYVITKWNTEDKSIRGNIYSDIENEFIEEELMYNSTTIYYDRIVNIPSKSELKEIYNSINLVIDINFDKCIKTNDKCYLLKKEQSDGKLKKCYHCHVINNNNVVSIMYDVTYGYMDYDDSLFIPTKVDRRKYLIFNLDSFKLIQEHNLNNNKYKYKKIVDNELIDIDIENFDSIYEINRGNNNGLVRRI